MKALFVSNLYPPVIFGGYEILCRQVADELRSRGWEIDILTSDFRSADYPEDDRLEVTLKLTTDFPLPDQPAPQTDFRPGTINRVAVFNEAATAKTLARVKPDVVFCWCLNRLSLGPVLAAQKAGIPVCYTINDKHPQQFTPLKNKPGLLAGIKGRIEKVIWPKFSFQASGPLPMTIISQALKNQLLSRHCPVEEAQVIYQGIQLDKFNFKPRSRREGEPLRVIYTGQLSRNKGVHTILKAAGVLNQRGPIHLSLRMIGDGVPDYRRELDRLVEQFKLKNHVRFLGWVDPATLPDLYHRNHLLVFSSEWPEPFGLTHLEAMASGTAVISTSTGGSAELIKHELNALNYRAGDAADLADKMTMILDDEALRLQLIDSARQYVEKHHDFLKYVDNLARFVEGVAVAGRQWRADG